MPMDTPQLLSHRFNNALHAVLLLGGLAALLAAIGWVLGGTTGLVWAGVLGAVALVFTPRISPKLILRMYRARPLAPAEAPALYEVVGRITGRAGMAQAPALYYVPTPILNAFSVGHRDDAVIAVTDGLLRNLSPREVTAVLAHEISHIRHNDMWIMGLADAVSRIVRGMSFVGQVLIIVNLPMLLLEYGALPWLPILLLLFAPTLSALLQLALSRNREFDADLEAARLTGDPEGLAQALERLELAQDRMWRHVLWPGYRNRQPSVLRTHPNSEERVARLKSLATGTSGFSSMEDLWHAPQADVTPPRQRWHGLWY